MSIPSPKNENYIDWASHWESLATQIAALQSEKKTLCAEIRDSRGRPTLEAFKQAMRVLHMDADKREAKAAIDQEAATIIAAIRSAAASKVNATDTGTSGAALEADEASQTGVKATPSGDAGERQDPTTEACDVQDAPRGLSPCSTIEEALADLPLDFADTELSSDYPAWEEDILVEEEPALAEAKVQPYDHAAYLRDKRDYSHIKDLVLGEPA